MAMGQTYQGLFTLSAHFYTAYVDLWIHHNFTKGHLLSSIFQKQCIYASS